MTKRQLFLVLFLNLFIASTFFTKNIGVGYSQLSSDMQNIVPICMKIDNPLLYTNDLYLTDTDNFKFYTPFFVETLRFFGSWTSGDYVLATNILLFISSLLYGICWFLLLFKFFGNKFWIAVLISILIRGIVWLPFWEFWGISDLWTMAPRTVYAALMPIPFLLLFKRTTISFYIASFLIGLIFNFHPISGLGGILIFVCFVACSCYYKYAKCNLKQLIFGMIFISLGMLPFILTYFGKTDTLIAYDINAFEAAFNSKIPARFQEVDLIFESWLKLKFLFFFIPLAVFVMYSVFISKGYRKQAWILTVITIGLFILPVLSIYLEQFLNHWLNINLRMSFQLVRIQKLAILPGYIAIGFLILMLFEKYMNLYRYFPPLIGGYLLLLIFTTPSSFRNVPFLGDDISNSIFPDFHEVIKPISQRETDMDKMAEYIEENTPISAVFYNNYYLRSAAKRSVRFDGKGANLLVEGNPQKLIEWHKAIMYLKTASQSEQITYLREAGVNYVLSQKREYPLLIVKQIGNLKLYVIN